MKTAIAATLLLATTASANTYEDALTACDNKGASYTDRCVSAGNSVSSCKRAGAKVGQDCKDRLNYELDKLQARQDSYKSWRENHEALFNRCLASTQISITNPKVAAIYQEKSRALCEETMSSAYAEGGMLSVDKWRADCNKKPAAKRAACIKEAEKADAEITRLLNKSRLAEATAENR